MQTYIPVGVDFGLCRNDAGGWLEWVRRYPESPFAIPAEFLTTAPTVIPAQAGIQWFKQAIPAERE